MVVLSILGLDLSANAQSVISEESYPLDGTDVLVVTLELSKHQVRVLSPRSSSYLPESAELSIRDGIFLTEFASRYRPEYVLSGGYLDSFAPPRSLGFLKVDGRSISKPHRSWLTSGVLCIDGDDVSIFRFQSAQSYDRFADCVQSGPLIVEDGIDRYASMEDITSGEHKLALANQAQAFVCLRADGKLVLGYSERGSTRSISRFAAEEIGCQIALRMSGGITAGLWSSASGLRGNSEVLLTNGIAIFLK
jgi:hypothetical protein